MTKPRLIDQTRNVLRVFHTIVSELKKVIFSGLSVLFLSIIGDILVR